MLLKFIRKHWLIVLIVAVGLFLRLYRFQDYFMYGHDQELIGWFVKDVLANHHFRLIGQETSSQGVFIGPLFYYLQIPFYLLTKMDPIGGIVPVTVLGVFTIFSFYWVFKAVFNKKVGIIAAVLYSTSYIIVFVDREVAPTMPVILWTVWYFYGLWLVLKGKKLAYIFLAFLIGLIWELNLALLLLTPLAVIAQLLSKKRISFKYLLLGLVTLIVVLSPFIVFEAKHGFSQTRAIVSSVTTNKDYEGGAKPGLAKLDRVMQIAYVNTTRLFWGAYYQKSLYKLTFLVIIGLFAYLWYKKILPQDLSILMILWIILYLAFFTINSINISEYYLNGMNVIWILIVSLGASYFLGKKNTSKLAMFTVFVFVALNIRSFILFNTNGNTYVQKKSLISYIKKDADSHGYPCVAISYITAPGYEFGFRYFYWLDGLKIKKPLSGAPIYNIVFPLSYVDHFDQRFGGLGLVLPDYKSYTNKSVDKACEGADVNLTEPMFGFTQ